MNAQDTTKQIYKNCGSDFEKTAKFFARTCNVPVKAAREWLKKELGLTLQK